MTRPIGVVLASGRGTRLGGPKALLRWPYLADGQLTLAQLHTRALLYAGCARVLIVTRADIAARLRPLLPSAARLIISAEPDQLGPAGSLRAATRAISRSDRLALITPVDAVPVRPAVYSALLRAMRSSAALAARPRHHHRRGHPVAVATSVLSSFASSPLGTLRQALRALGPACIDVPVLDPAIALDLDTPADWRRLATTMGRTVPPPLLFATH